MNSQITAALIAGILGLLAGYFLPAISDKFSAWKCARKNRMFTANERFTGLVVAPNGDVTLNGNDVKYTGSIIAQNIIKNGGKITVTYSDLVDDHLPKGKVRLIA